MNASLVAQICGLRNLFPREPLTKERVPHNRRDSRRFSYDKFRHCLLPYASHQIWLEKIPPTASPQASGQDMVSYLGEGSQHLFSTSVTRNALNGLVSDAVPWDCLILLFTIKESFATYLLCAWIIARWEVGRVWRQMKPGVGWEGFELVGQKRCVQKILSDEASRLVPASYDLVTDSVYITTQNAVTSHHDIHLKDLPSR